MSPHLQIICRHLWTSDSSLGQCESSVPASAFFKWISRNPAIILVAMPLYFPRQKLSELTTISNINCLRFAKQKSCFIWRYSGRKITASFYGESSYFASLVVCLWMCGCSVDQLMAAHSGVWNMAKSWIYSHLYNTNIDINRYNQLVVLDSHCVPASEKQQNDFGFLSNITPVHSRACLLPRRNPSMPPGFHAVEENYP